MDTAKRINELLQRQNVSQQEFAEYLGLSQSFLSRLLNGKRTISLEIIEKSCEFFQIELQDFFRTDHQSVPSYVEDFCALCRKLTESEVGLLRSIAEIMPSMQNRKGCEAENK